MALCTAVFEVLALQCVWQTINIPARFVRFGIEDDEVISEYFPAGIPHPVDYEAFFKEDDRQGEYSGNGKMGGVLLITAFPLLFCCVCITVSIRSEIAEFKVPSLRRDSEAFGLP